ncbi:MAG: hypothetical protein AAF267_12485, partial [Deinococcota bacterium]
AEDLPKHSYAIEIKDAQSFVEDDEAIHSLSQPLLLMIQVMAHNPHRKFSFHLHLFPHPMLNPLNPKAGKKITMHLLLC